MAASVRSALTAHWWPEVSARTERDDQKRPGSRIENGLISWDNRHSVCISARLWQHPRQVRARSPKKCCTSVGCKPAVSPGLRAGCGLKRLVRGRSPSRRTGFTRPSGRVRIETQPSSEKARNQLTVSPGLRAGCGLKPALPTPERRDLCEFHPAFGPGAD